ncbi:MAG TPA: hypothetical protein VIR15_10735 [Intrasporangium sp.]|jgi:hypothetical protein
MSAKAVTMQSAQWTSLTGQVWQSMSITGSALLRRCELSIHTLWAATDNGPALVVLRLATHAD